VFKQTAQNLPVNANIFLRKVDFHKNIGKRVYLCAFLYYNQTNKGTETEVTI